MQSGCLTIREKGGIHDTALPNRSVFQVFWQVFWQD